MNRKTPHFLIIGAQKCGTTWLHHLLQTHPQVFLPEHKDHEFFSYTLAPTATQINSWLERYAIADDDIMIGDATASYFWTPLAPPYHDVPNQFNLNIAATMHRVLGDQLKIIIMLRDPVKRAISAYLHHISMGSLSPATSLFDAPGRLGIISIGFFGQHLRHWLQYYPKQSIYVETRSIKQQHQNILGDVQHFLGVEPFSFEDSAQVIYGGMQRVIKSDGVWLPTDRLQNLQEIQRALPFSTINGERYIRVIHPSEITALKSVYASDQQLLQQLTDNHDC